MVSRYPRKAFFTVLIVLVLFSGCVQPSRRMSIDNPSRPDSVTDLVQAENYYEHDNYDDAIIICDRVLADDPDNSNALHTRGRSLAGNGFYPDALVDIKRACELSPNAIEFFYTLAWVASANYEHNTSLEAYKRVFELDPDGSERAYNGRAWANIQLGRFDTALEDVNKAIELYPGNPNYIDTRAVYWLKVGEYDKALEDINHAIHIAPDTAEHHYHKGLIYIEMEKWIEAFDELTIAYRAESRLKNIDELLAFTEGKVLEQFGQSGDQ